MSRSHRYVAVPAALLVLAAATACGGSDGSTSSATGGCTPKHSGVTTLTKGKLAVSVYVSPPYSEQKDGGFGGVDGEIIKKIAEMECLTLDAKPVAGAGLISSVESKRADLAIGGVYRTPDRAKILELTDTVYKDGMALLSKSEVSDVASLKGKKVGVIQGYLWNADLQKVLGKDNVKIYQASDGMLSDLTNGRVDVGVLTTAEAGYRAKQNTALKSNNITSDPRIASSTAPGEVVFPLTKGNASLLAALNEDIKALVADGTVGKILEANGLPASAATA
ncbi:MAG: amino acid transporter substrate-binding protein [Frankiales bacterium]|jgi:polar amino acid transport system substrate-binding protein|nr:amino acid transporter substrate-binding protein [Frankiales bacterium]